MNRSGGLGRLPRLGILVSVAAVTVLPALSACTFVSPQTTTKSYAAGDGTNGAITDPATGASVELRNFLMVSTDKGSPGALVGAVLNQGTSAVTVNFTVLNGQTSVGTGSVSVQPNVLTQVGPDADAKVTIDSMPTAPGTVLQLRAETAGGGGQTISLPVLAAQGEYSSLTATVAPTPSETSTPSVSASASPSS